ncbi:MAG: chloride channel protein, partial [Muribaculum sp.]|nr:chloride channel protein [Muribaculum sp.]
DYIDNIKQSATVRLGAAAVVAGVLIGVAGWLLKWLVKTISTFVTSGFDLHGSNWWLIGVPVIGFLIVGWFVRNVVKQPLEESTARMKADIADGDGKMPARLTVSSMIASSLTLGFGGSAGSEGPIAYTGAAIGSNVARIFGLDRRQLLIFLACGAGAGIAAIFKAPVGGMFFTLEVLRMTLGVSSLLMLAAMCLISGITAYLLSGCTTDMAVPSSITFDISMIPALLLMAVVAGAYAAYYLSTGLYVRRRLHGVARPIVRNIISGLTVGVLLFLFPALYGEGYSVLSQVANGHMSAVIDGSIAATLSGTDTILWILAGILLTKSIACYSSNSGGGVAGDFAPTLFVGGLAGAFIALCAAHLPIMSGVPADTMVVCGMAAVMAGVVRAPLMTIFIVVEMTHT